MKGIKSKKIPPDHLKETHEMLRQQIKILTEDIEMKINSSKTHKHKPKDHVTEQSGRLNEDLFPVQITNYKTAIGNHKAKLEGFFNLKKVESIEEEIKRKRELLFNVKYENNVLNNIHKTQQNAIKDYRNKFQNKNEQLVLNDKLRALKEEFKYTKDLQINFQERLKKQNEKILMLEDRCQLIRDNIERKKKQTLSVTPSEDDVIRNLEKEIEFKEMQINSEETKYKEEVSKQIEMISNLNDESSKIKLQVKDKEQVIRILSLKLKEISGIHLNKFQNKREESIGSYKSNKPFTKIKLSNSQNNVKDDIGRLKQEIKFTMVKHEKILHNKSSFGLKHESILDEIINSNNQDHSLMISNIEKIDNSLLHDYHSNKNISNLQHMHGHGNNKPIHIEEN